MRFVTFFSFSFLRFYGWCFWLRFCRGSGRTHALLSRALSRHRFRQHGEWCFRAAWHSSRCATTARQAREAAKTRHPHQLATGELHPAFCGSCLTVFRPARREGKPRQERSHDEPTWPPCQQQNRMFFGNHFCCQIREFALEAVFVAQISAHGRKTFALAGAVPPQIVLEGCGLTRPWRESNTLHPSNSLSGIYGTFPRLNERS